jgi:hypothetical protein
MKGDHQLPAQTPLCSGKEPQIPTNRRLGGPQGQSEHFGEEKNLLPLRGIKSQTIQSTPAIHTVTLRNDIKK